MRVAGDLDGRKDALGAFDAFIQTWGVKQEKAAECLIKDRDALLARPSLETPAFDELHETSFATVRLQTARSKARLSNKTALAMTSSSPRPPREAGVVEEECRLAGAYH